MSERAVFVAGAPLRRDTREVAGALVELGGERFYRIANHDAMAPFFMSLVSDSDHWLFASSNGALTAGRRDPDRALFPYYTDDRIHDSQDQTGSKTLLHVARAGMVSLWEPFSLRYQGLYRVERNLYKSVVGNKLLFEERNADLALVFRYDWTTSERFGFVRRATLQNTGDTPVEIEVLELLLQYPLQRLDRLGTTSGFEILSTGVARQSGKAVVYQRCEANGVQCD